MKTLTTLMIAAFVFTGTVNAQLLVEDFEYSAGALLTDNGWSAHSGAGSNPMTVVSPGLTYTNYPGSNIGNAVQFGGTSGEDVSRNFTEQTSGAVYASFMVNVSAAETNNGDYFFHFGPTSLGSTFRGKTFAADDGSGNLKFGLSFLRNNDSSPPPQFAPGNYAYNTTYVLVVKFVLIPGADNDETSMYVFTDPNLPGVEPGSPDVGPIMAGDEGASGADPSNLGTIALRKSSAGEAPTLTVDGIRVSVTWEGLVGNVDPPPSIQNISRTPFIPDPAQSVFVSADLADNSGISSAFLYWTVNGGSVDSTAMNFVGGDLYEGEIPGAAHASAADVISFWLEVTDDSSNTSSVVPQEYLVGTVEVSDIRMNDGDGVNLFVNHAVRLTGTVTAGDSTFDADDLNIYVQDATGGVNVLEINNTTLYPEGTILQIEGTLDQFNGELALTTPELNITPTGTGPVPAPLIIGPGDLDESVEGLLITITDVQFDSTGVFEGFTEYTYNGGQGIIFIDSDTDIPGNPIPAGVVNVRGIGSQFSSAFPPYVGGHELLPRRFSDIDVSTSIDDGSTIVPDRVELSQNYPNPFNPSTSISFSVPTETNVRLDIFNIRGERVATLVNGSKSGGVHTVAWTGSNQAGQKVSSGVYFYRLQAGASTFSRKMLLVK